MMFKALFSLILSLFGFSTHAQQRAQEADRIWFDIAEKMASAGSSEEMSAILNQNLPDFASQLEKDSENRALLDLWGMSRNIDESHLSDGIHTVPVNVLEYFNSIFNVNFDETYTFGHAGLTHTYGYLMSNLQTPFGFKRARYVAGELEAGFGLPETTFSGLPTKGTLLSNLSMFAGRIAFRDCPEMMERMMSEVSEIANYDFSSLKVSRLVEQVKNERFTLELRTDIVSFPHSNPNGKNTAMLVYSIDFLAPGEKSQPRLITVFPVEIGFVNGVFSPSGLGDHMAIKLKYNAALPVTIPAEEMVGKRFIANENSTAQHPGSRP